ncbi:endonuclease domain-containing protein [Blastococcus sp. SYSU DS0539]
MPTPSRVPDRLRGTFFRGSSVVRAGLLTRPQLRGPAWRRLFRDVYVDAGVPETYQLRARAAAAVLLPGAVVTGASAAVLWGVDLADVRDDVELTLPAGAHPRRHPGLVVRRTSLDESDVCLRAGVRVTTPLATALRLAGVLPRDEAVVAIDRMVAATDLHLGELRARAASPGAAPTRVRTACALADGLAESPQETRLRLLLHRARLPAPVAQHVVRHDGGFVARVDFAWPELKVAVEYDGAWHGGKGQFARDRRRLNRLQEAGWRVVFVTAADLHDPARLLATIRAALAR